MPAPVTLPGWRAFMARPDPRPPRRRSLTQLNRLSATAREAYDQQRMAWLGEDIVFDTRDIQDLSLAVNIAIRRNIIGAVGPRRGVAISGDSTLGKTTAVLHLGRAYEISTRRHDSDDPRSNGRNSHQPVVYIVVPAATTPKMMLGAFARFLGLPVTGFHRTRSDLLSDQCASVLTDLRTRMIIIDEVHNLHTNRQVGAEAASALKMFGDRLDATFVYAGIDLPGADLFTGAVGRQIAGRVVMHTMKPYRNHTATQRREWAELVDLCDQLVILAKHQPGSLTAHADYLYDRTEGSLGSLRALIADATIRAILTGAETLNRRTLDQTPADHRIDTNHAQPDPSPRQQWTRRSRR